MATTERRAYRSQRSTKNSDRPTPRSQMTSEREQPSEPASGDPDRADLKALRRREGWAIRHWIYAERDYVRHVLLRHGAEGNELDDLMQEVFYQAIRSLPSFEGNAKVTTWLYSIARNVAYTHQRNARSHRSLTDDLLRHLQPQIDGARSMSAELSGPREDTIQRELSALIRDALEQLPDHYAEIIRLRDLQEQSTREAAQGLGITEVNARVRLHRARKALRTKMEEVLSTA